MTDKEIIDYFCELALRERIKDVCPGYGTSAVDAVVKASMGTRRGLTRDTLRRAIVLAYRAEQAALELRALIEGDTE